jgi:hypothetical protein
VSKFNEIRQPALRAYNRCVYAFNLLEDQGRAPMEEYIAQFNKEDRILMGKVYTLTKKIGPKKVIELVTKGIDFGNDDNVVQMVPVAPVEKGVVFDE